MKEYIKLFIAGSIVLIAFLVLMATSIYFGSRL
jgi:hypothetical protein